MRVEDVHHKGDTANFAFRYWTLRFKVATMVDLNKKFLNAKSTDALVRSLVTSRIGAPETPLAVFSLG